MVISLYVCEIPKNVNKNDLEELFKSMDGYLESRVKGLNEMRKIAFIDFKDLGQARFAMVTLQGFKFSPSDKGLIIKVSDNTKGGTNQTRFKKSRVGTSSGNNNSSNNNNDTSPRKFSRDSPDRHSRSRIDHHHRRRRDNKSDDSDSYRSRSASRSRSTKHSDDSTHNYNYNPPQDQSANPSNILDLISLLNTANSAGGLNNINSLSGSLSNLNQSNATITPNTSLPPNTSITPNTASTSTNKPYTLSENQPDTSSFSNLIECLQNLQTVQLLSSLTGSSAPVDKKEVGNNPSGISGMNNINSHGNHGSHNMPSHSSHIIPPTHSSHNNVHHASNANLPSSQFVNSLNKIDDYFNSTTDFKKNATNIVYVEGLPCDTTEREVSHMFRPFVGFKSVRLITREKNGQKSLICFADFDQVIQSTICINTLQGYRFDKNDLIGLHFSYGVNKYKDRK